MVDRARRLVIAVLATAAALGTMAEGALGPVVARAHLGHLSLRAERYLKLDVRNDTVRAVMSLQLEGAESLRAREHVDADHDGTMTAREVQDALGQWRAQLRRELAFTVGGRPAAARWDEGVIVPIGPVRTTSTTIELVTRVALPAGERVRIELRDALTFAGLQSTELRLEPNDGIRFEVADVAPGTGVVRRMTLPEVASTARPRTIVVVARRAETPARRGGEPAPWSPLRSVLVFLGLVAAAGVVAGIVMVRRRRRIAAARRP
ncbi:MAG: hypothetical protein IT379_20140 [Deltaproteobacteria bacterium]|nr:hypothetical protein [Deltaproteobacteria bacterium]